MNKLPDSITRDIYVLLDPYTEQIIFCGAELPELGYTTLHKRSVTISLPQVKIAELKCLENSK